MSTTVFTGCSTTKGYGLALKEQDPRLWVNLLHQQNQLLSKTNLLNLGYEGKSNANIFLDSVEAMLNLDNTKFVIVQWASAPRYEISLGLELYNTTVYFLRNGRTQQKDQHLNDITFPGKWLDKFGEQLTSLSHPHAEILAVIKYTNQLIKIAKLKNIEIFFVAAPAIWDNDYFTKIDLDKNFDITTLTPLTQRLLNVHNRDDDEIIKLYNRMHDDYEQAGGIQPNYWCFFGEITEEYNAKKSAGSDSHWLPETHEYIAKLCSDKINAKLLK